MIDVPVYNASGNQVGTVALDEARFGGEVRPALLKQAVVMYQANRRQGTVGTKSRGMVEGSTRKIYRQKGSGNARMGTVRTPVRRGGGHAFAKRTRDFSQSMPKRMRRLARDNAILAKAQANDVLVIEGLEFDAPKTKRFASLLSSVGADRGCLLALHEPNENVWKSARNIPRTEVCAVEQLNAYEILRRKKLMLTMPAFKAITKGDKEAKGDRATKGDRAAKGDRPSKWTVEAEGESSS